MKKYRPGVILCPKREYLNGKEAQDHTLRLLNLTSQGLWEMQNSELPDYAHSYAGESYLNTFYEIVSRDLPYCVMVLTSNNVFWIIRCAAESSAAAMEQVLRKLPEEGLISRSTITRVSATEMSLN